MLIPLLALLGLVVSACSAGDSATETTVAGATDLDRQALTRAAEEAASTGTTAASAPAEEPATDESYGADVTPSENAGNGGVDPVLNGPVDIGRDIIFTADITLAVPDVAEAGARAARVIERFGGLVFGQETTGGNRPRTILTFKVLPEDFQAVLSELGSIGEIRNQNVSANDVTERVVDLRSRITTAEASVTRLRSFLENAQDLDTIASLENQLLQRETDLETLRGQLRTLENQVSLATIVMTITEARIEPGIVAESTFYPGHDDGGFACPGATTLTVETGDDFTACFFISNSGDTPLAELTLVDSVLGIALDDLTPVFGDPTAVLLPGESLMLSYEATADANLRTRTTVTGVPADADGVALDERPVASTVTAAVQTVPPEGIADFGEGLAASWQLLLSLGRAALLVVAWVLPFSWLVIVGWWLWRRGRRQPAGRAPNSSFTHDDATSGAAPTPEEEPTPV